jgi:serine/threonine-protein kinase
VFATSHDPRNNRARSPVDPSDSVVAHAPEELIGAVVDGRYTLRKVLVAGGFGAVFAAEDREGPRCAVKLVPFASFVERAMAQREAARLGDLAHPGLVALRGSGRFGPTARGYVYIAMELGERSLDARVREDGPLDAAELRALLLDLLDALEHLHARGVVHGDVKPGNVVRVGERYKLCDLGSAREIGGAPDRGAWRSGTPEVMAPEAFDGEAIAASDLWSLGLLVHECATGKQPFRVRGLDHEAIARVVRETEPSLDPALAEPFAAIVRGCLARDPSRRFTAADVRRALAAAPEDLPAPRRSFFSRVRSLFARM